MKTVIAEIKNPAPGDLIILQYRSPRGGRTHVMHTVMGAHQRAQIGEGGIVTALEDVAADTPRGIANIFAGLIAQQWMPEAFQAKVKDDTGQLIINCNDVASDVVFSADIEGDGGTTVSLMEF